VSGAGPWIAVALLGAYHGLDPSMGWLFAVGLGLQERRLGKVIAALAPIAIGHLISIAAAVVLIASAMAHAWGFIRPLGAASLVGFGLFRLARPQAHPRWVAMRVSSLDLILWSFLMATAHGAGLMLFPALMKISPGQMPIHHYHQLPPITSGALRPIVGAAVVLLHTGTMFVVMGIVAVVVYEWIGLQILRSAWINLNTIWAGALIAAGILSLII
jgi:hypothetical protein